VTEGKVNGITMTPSPPPPNKHRRNRDNIISNTASNYISVFSVIVFISISGCVRPLTATPAPFVSSTSSETMVPLLPLQQADEPFSADVIDNFLTNRCGTCNPDESPALWSYEGTLTDPTTGKVIAEVEGLELIKRLPVVERTQFIDNNERSMLGKLHAKSLLCSENNSTPQWDVAMTVLCRRLFCYRRRNSIVPVPNPGSSTESSPCNSLLTSLRLRPDGPLRHLSPSESMSIYDSALTYISRNKGRELVILSERGGCESTNPEDAELKNQFVMGNAEINSSNKKSPYSLFEYSILARRGSEWNGPAPLPPLKAPGQVESADVTISPPRSRFLQFGKGDGSDNSSARKYGSARETYSYTLDNDFESADDSSSTNDGIFVRIVEKFGVRRPRETPIKPKNQCRVVYTRYGEAPPWYAPGRSCTLELRGERINVPEYVELAYGKSCTSDSSASSPNLPSIASWAASKCNFWSGWPTLFSDHRKTADCVDLVKQYYQMPPESEVALARRAVELFCSERNLSFDRMENEYPIPERNRWLASTENVLTKVQGCMKRFSKSLIM
jgi:hypothetical protein